jgi:hypothetical protein
MECMTFMVVHSINFVCLDVFISTPKQNCSMDNETSPLPTASPALSIVWVYKAKYAVDNEIEVSIALAKKNLSNAQDFYVCGDQVPGTQTIHSQGKHRGVFAKWYDSITKLQDIINCPQVTDDFLWLYDDTFVIQPLTPQEIAPPRYSGEMTKYRALSTWQGVANETMKLFSPCLNFSSHYPMVYNKHLLQSTIDTYLPLKKPYLIETLYGNHHLHLNPQPTPDWFEYLRFPVAPPAKTTKLLNVGTFNLFIKNFLNSGPTLYSSYNGSHSAYNGLANSP